MNHIVKLLKDYVLSVSKLRRIMAMFEEEMKLGLEAKPSRQSAFYMCNTFVTDCPDGTEEGDILSMDLGNSNFRLLLTRLKPGKKPEFIVKHYELSTEYRRGKPDKLFDYLAVCIEDFVNTNPDIGGKRLPFGMTFSFGYDQTALNVGIIKQFGIDTDLPEAVDKDAVKYLQDAIDRKGLKVDVLSIANDTTATLAYGMSLKPDTYIGFILGSGTNTCYLENVDRIEKIDPLKTFGTKTESVILNLENGFLGDNGSIDFVKTKWDLEVDNDSLFPHNYSFEKLIGGAFIGDLFRRTLLSLAENHVFLGGIITDRLKQKDSIKGPDVSSVESDETDGSVIALLQRLGYSSQQITKDDIEIVRYVCALIGVRNAQLAAATLSPLIQRIDKPMVRIAADGSPYKKHPKLHKLITDFISELIPNRKFELFLAEDGSGKGSAFIAAVAAKQRQKS
ncbi:unnamed protein product [Medioppia subpectinata]|uniref:Phosphotransferase n=1 Tax=Medioppia subpectinata TaxID=1979941 RepID=A0A7R9KSD7_9ACAR|nr:unnamed protein product [Medioppia subpectinata]CAG2108517.1 unnamed protein product [Medioppia subpectinata]